MKYKALLTGNNKMVIREFFSNMDFSFECLTTSIHYDDIMNHFKYVHPDVFVYCLYGEKIDEIKKFSNAGKEIDARKIPLVIIGDKIECNQFMKLITVKNILALQKPVSVHDIEEKIVDMLDNKKRIERRESESEKVAQMAASAADAIKEAEKLIAQMDVKNSASDENRRKHILVVDDDSGVLKLVKSYLSSNYDVATAKSGKVAMKFLENKTTDLVLLDYEMPDENGPAVLAKLRASNKTKNLPVVFLTGVKEKEKIQEVLAMKPRGYLLKPIDMMKLTSTIKTIFGEKKARGGK